MFKIKYFSPHQISTFLLLTLMLVFLLGCNNDENVQISSGDNLTHEQIQEAESLDKASYAGLEDVFLDTKHIASFDNKLPLLVFGRNNCIYCEKLKDDIKDDPTLKKMLQDHFSPFYINMSYTKKHRLTLGDQDSILNTDALADTFFGYAMRPTPTLIFLNQQGDVLYRLPGYLPNDKLLKILGFMSEPQANQLSMKQISEQINALIED